MKYNNKRNDPQIGMTMGRGRILPFPNPNPKSSGIPKPVSILNENEK
jgi:hypothetical protein